MFTNATALTPKTGGANQALFALILTFSRPPSPRLPPSLKLGRTGWRIFEEKEQPSDYFDDAGAGLGSSGFGKANRRPPLSPSAAPPPLKLGRAGRRERAGVRASWDYVPFSKPDLRPSASARPASLCRGRNLFDWI